MRTVIVEVKNDILGDGVFWRGPENLIEEIRNLPARMLARSVVATGKPAQAWMWRVRIEEWLEVAALAATKGESNG